MQLIRLVLLATTAFSCTVILQAQPGDTNLLSILAELSSAESPLVLCLEGSDPYHRFTLDESYSGCWWSSAEVVIT